MIKVIKRVRWANHQHVGILVEYGSGPSLYVLSGSLYEEAISGSFGPVLEPEEVLNFRESDVTPEEVNAERDRRLDLSFEYLGRMIQRDPVSLRRIQGAAQMATIAMMSGASPDSMEWVNGQPLVWITEDNTELSLSPSMTIGLGTAAAEIESRLVRKARALKSMDPIPLNFSDDIWWEDQQ